MFSFCFGSRKYIIFFMKKEPIWKYACFIFDIRGDRDIIYDDSDDYWSMMYKDQWRSKMTITKWQKHTIFLVKHNISHRFHRKPDINLIDMERTPVQSFLFIEIFMTFLYHIRCHIGIQMMDVMVFYPIGEWLQKQWDLQICTSL